MEIHRQDSLEPRAPRIRIADRRALEGRRPGIGGAHRCREIVEVAGVRGGGATGAGGVFAGGGLPATMAPMVSSRTSLDAATAAGGRASSLVPWTKAASRAR